MVGAIFVIFMMTFVMAKGRILYSICLLNTEMLICALFCNILRDVPAEDTSSIHSSNLAF